MNRAVDNGDESTTAPGRRPMLDVAFEKTWFYAVTLAIAALYGMGGLVHVGNVLGFGELEWSEAPLAWKVGDLVWGSLDVVAVIGIVLKAPVGILAVVVAAASQIVVYGLFPHVFALTDRHRATLRAMVYFHAAVLVVLVLLVRIANGKDRTLRTSAADR